MQRVQLFPNPMHHSIQQNNAPSGPVDRTLRRLIKKPEIARHVLPLFQNADAPRALTDNNGVVLTGDETVKSGPSTPIVLSDVTLGYAWGDRSEDIARAFGALAAQDREIRALGRESLEKYREISMLYSLAEKIITAPDPNRIATVVCEEALRFLRCDCAALLHLNAETQRLEIIANQGKALQKRATRDIGTDVISAVLTSGVGEIVNDISNDVRSLDADNAPTSVVLSPLKTNEKTFGILVVGSERSRHFNAGDLQVLNAIAAHAAGAIEVNRLNRDLAETVRKPRDLIYGVNDIPPVGISILLASQHAFVSVLSLAYPVMVVLEAGGNRLSAASAVSLSLIAMAIGTLVQTLRGGVVGSGYFAPYVCSGIFLVPALQAVHIGGLSLVFGMMVFSGFVSLGFSWVLKRYRWLFPPEVSGVVVLMVGLTIVPFALPRFVGLGDGDTISNTAEWTVGLVTLCTIILLTVVPFGKVRLFSTAIGFVTGYVVAAWLGLFDGAIYENVRDLPIVGLHAFKFYGLSFEPTLILPFLAATIASNISDGGLIISSQKTNDSSWTKTDTGSLGGGIVASGIANISSGVLGGVSVNISGGNISLAAATGSTSRHIGVYLAGIFLIMAFTPKLTAMLAYVPSPVLGAGLLFLSSNLISAGVSLISSRMLDARRNFVVGIPLIAGIGMIALPELFDSAPDWVRVIGSSPLAWSTILALALNIALNAGVANRASTRLRFDETLSEFVNRFVSRQGASWGARGGVMRRAAPAITEWCEELRQTLGRDAATLDLQFDDFRLTATIRALEGENGDIQMQEDLAGVIDRAARNISRRYGCGVQLNTVREVVFDFEH